MGHVFISYAQERAEEAHGLAAELRALGVTPWIAPDDIAAGRRWTSAISESIRQSDAMVVLVSRTAVTSPHVFREVGIAVTHGIPIVPASLDDVELSDGLDYLLAQLHFFDARPRLDRPTARRLATQVAQLVGPDEVPARVDHVVDADRAASAPPPRPPDPLAFRVTRARPAYFALLIDCSHSMNKTVDGTRHRREVVADMVNDLLATLVDRSVQDDDHIHHYFDVSVLGYGLGDGWSVESLLGDDIVSIVDLARSAEWTTFDQIQTQPDGTTVTVTAERPVWVAPTAKVTGHTVTGRGFKALYPLLRTWVDDHADSIPPIVLHITDGGWDTNEEPHSAIRALQELRTNVGNVLVFNCHVFGDEAPLVFPPAEMGDDFDPRMRDLLDLSSELPRQMVALGQEAGYDVEPGSRGYVHNGDADVLADFIDIGTLGKGRVI